MTMATTVASSTVARHTRTARACAGPHEIGASQMQSIANVAHLSGWLGPKLSYYVSGRLGVPVTFARWAGAVPVFRVPFESAAKARELGITIEVAGRGVPQAPTDRAIRQAPEHEELPPLTDRGTPEQECFDQNITEPPCEPVAPRDEPEPEEDGGEA